MEEAEQRWRDKVSKAADFDIAIVAVKIRLNP